MAVKPVRGYPSVRFGALLALGVVAACAGYAALVLATANWTAIVMLRTHFDWVPRAVTPSELAALRMGLSGLAGGALVLAAGIPGRAEWQLLGREVASAARGLRAGWRGLTPGQRRGAGAALLLLTALRVYYSYWLQVYDDASSYELFVREPLLTVSAAYPLPNNHVGSNTVSWLFYQLNSSFWFSMRLPVLLAATGATGLWFLALLRRSNFRVALLAVGLFGLLQSSFYHAAQGRGYWWVVGLSAVGFFAGLELAAPAGRFRAAWAALVLSGVLGLYVVPTHAYLLWSVYSWLGLGWVRRTGWALGWALAMGGLTLLGAALLYVPLLLVSGPRLLLHNPALYPLEAGEFWHTVLVYIWYNEGRLSGYRWLGARPVQLVVLGLAVLWARARRGQLAGADAHWAQALAPASVWCLGAPYLLVLIQGVEPPERTLFYKAQFFFVGLALLTDWGLRQAGPGAGRWGQRVLMGAALAYGLGQLRRVDAADQAQQRWPGAPLFRAGADWLASQPAGPVLVQLSPPIDRRQLRFYAHARYRTRRWQFDDVPRPGVRYRYLVVAPATDQPQYRGRPVVGAPVLHCAAFDIFMLP